MDQLKTSLTVHTVQGEQKCLGRYFYLTHMIIPGFFVCFHKGYLFSYRTIFQGWFYENEILFLEILLLPALIGKPMNNNPNLLSTNEVGKLMKGFFMSSSWLLILSTSSILDLKNMKHYGQFILSDTTKKKDSERCIFDIYSINTFVVSWLKWLKMILNELKWPLLIF